ncbi:MAG: S41 family peptidase [Flavobacteriales bacterium]
MKAHFIVLILFMTSQLANSQDCKCQKDFEFVVDYYEENLPGFKDNVSEDNLEEYEDFKNTLYNLSKDHCSDEDLCFKTLLVYVEFFKDNHSSIYTNNSVVVDESRKKEVKRFLNSEFFLHRETIENINLNTTNPIEELENSYQTKDAAYTVTIVKNKNNFRDYVGVIIDSKTPLWKQGQVKFELKKVGENSYDMFMYMRNHSLRYHKNVKLVDGVLNDNWYNVNLEEKQSYNIDLATSELTFEEIDDEINFMYIPTFDGNWYSKISQFYEEHRATILSKPYLIIDVRNNGGGSDACVSPLLEYIYTKPFRNDEVDVYATKENIRKSSKWIERMKKDTANFDKEFIAGFEEEIGRMKSVPNKTFIPRSTGEMISMDSVLSNPQKVVIITNKYCASSCETLLFWAMESDKTIIVGENSGGYVGYGEISGIETPNFNFELGCTMTRYANQRKYEVDGVPPNQYLNNHKDWIEQVIEILKNN